MNNTSNDIKVEFGRITLDEITENIYKPNQDQAQIRQLITRTYPSSKVGNSNSDLLFGADDFDLEEGQSYTQQRVTWVPVPKGTTEMEFKAKLDQFPDARIYRIISNNVEDVLTDEQINAVTSTSIDITMEDYKEKFLVRDSEGNELEVVQYAQNFFSLKAVEDVDLRVKITASTSVIAESSVEQE